MHEMLNVVDELKMLPAHADIELRNRCTRWLNGHRPQRSMREVSLQTTIAPELPRECGH